ncbi:MAG: HAMP domain-containing histidine kinase [Nitrospina sp.]|nr:HAMP domain-containing histidine kinase [Nitrospina sp.]MBT6717626.1 HAMP domain-containing histidine kinase [Nitrospina sp.]
MNKIRALFHPIMVFIGVQIAWIVLMAVWINWYLENNLSIKELAQKIRPDLFHAEVEWLILFEGCFLMLLILAGVYVIFVYWNKQNRLNQMQSNFVASVSHELKSPLASIQLYLETLKYQEVSNEESKDFVETMLSDTSRLSSLIENILQSSKADPKSMELQLEKVDLGKFLSQVVGDHRRQFEEKKCDVKLQLDASPVLTLDKKALQMVFNNLIGNALRYSPVGSDLKIQLHRSGRFWDVDFEDKGIGFEKKDMKKVFKKFYRVQNEDTRNIEGAGLGLFISREIVRNHKGKLKVMSAGRGQGAVFTVSLPVSRGLTV